MAPRERKPALAALAVLLVLAGALGATVMVMRAGNKIEVVEVTDSVAAGQPIPSGAITEVEVSEVSGITFIRWGQRGDLLKNWRAATNLKKGMLLTLPMVTRGRATVAAGKSIVGLSLKDGQFPPGLQPGDVVTAFRVGNDVAKSSGGSSAAAGGSDDDQTISTRLVVLDVSSSSGDFSSGNTSVKVEADSSDAGALAAAASADDVALVLVSGKN